MPFLFWILFPFQWLVFPHQPSYNTCFFVFVLKCWILCFYFVNIVCFILSSKLKWFCLSSIICHVYILSLCGTVNLGLHFHVLRFPQIYTLFTCSWPNAHKSNISHILHGLHKSVKVGIYCRLVSLSLTAPTLSLVLGTSLELLGVSSSLYRIKCQLNFILVILVISQKYTFCLEQNVPHCEENHNKTKIKCNCQSKKCLKVLGSDCDLDFCILFVLILGA